MCVMVYGYAGQLKEGSRKTDFLVIEHCLFFNGGAWPLRRRAIWEGMESPVDGIGRHNA